MHGCHGDGAVGWHIASKERSGMQWCAGSCEAGLGNEQHPDAVAFNSAMWACLGDPMDALSALGA